MYTYVLEYKLIAYFWYFLSGIDVLMESLNSTVASVDYLVGPCTIIYEDDTFIYRTPFKQRTLYIV